MERGKERLKALKTSIYLCIALALLCAFDGNMHRIQMKMRVRTAHAGQMEERNTLICYSEGGKLVAYMDKPQEFVMVNNAKGELSIYNPATKSMKQWSDLRNSTESTIFYFFSNPAGTDLGLAKMGFGLASNKREGKLLISEWKAPFQYQKTIEKVKLVIENGKPIYLEYRAPKGKLLSKTFFYQYQSYPPLQIPASVTSISYTGPGDSVLTKTSFSEIKLDAQATSAYFNFKIPTDAKPEK